MKEIRAFFLVCSKNIDLCTNSTMTEMFIFVLDINILKYSVIGIPLVNIVLFLFLIKMCYVTILFLHLKGKNLKKKFEPMFNL